MGRQAGKYREYGRAASCCGWPCMLHPHAAPAPPRGPGALRARDLDRRAAPSSRDLLRPSKAHDHPRHRHVSHAATPGGASCITPPGRRPTHRRRRPRPFLLGRCMHMRMHVHMHMHMCMRMPASSSAGQVHAHAHARAHAHAHAHTHARAHAHARMHMHMHIPAASCAGQPHAHPSSRQTLCARLCYWARGAPIDTSRWRPSAMPSPSVASPVSR